MTVEESFNVVVKYGFCGNCRWDFEDKHCVKCDCYQRVKFIKEALEKQIPFKPTHCNSTFGRCKCGVGFLDKLIRFCGNCGQAIDWSEE